MPKRKAARQCKIMPWLSANMDCKEGRFIQVGNSLLLSKKYHSLKPTARLLYLAMSMESSGNSGFTLSHGAARRKYGISRSSYDRGIGELISAGFIVRADKAFEPLQANKFRFVSSWK